MTENRATDTKIAAWKEELTQAARQKARGPRAVTLFLEDRVGLTLEGATGADPEPRWSRVRGLSAESGPRSAHVSDPVPGQAVRLVGALESGDVPAAGPSADADPDAPGRLDAGTATSLVERVVAAVGSAAARGTAVARWVGFEQRVVVARPGAPAVHDVRRGERLRLEVRLMEGTRSSLGIVEWDLLSAPADPVELARRAVDRAARRLGAEPARGGEAILVLAPGVGGILMHEIVGHGLEADVAARGTWIASIRGRLASRDLMVADDPRRGRAAWRIDDEGHPARPVALIRDGRVGGQLRDHAWAKQGGARPTGHGRRSSYKERVRPRMGCTFIAAGSAHAEDIVATVAEGVYVRRMESAVTDPMTGRAAFRVIDADRIENGEIAAPLMPHLIVVEARDTLASIDRIGDDLEFDTCIGSCHRDGQPLAIGVGAPTIRLGMATVVG